MEDKLGRDLNWGGKKMEYQTGKHQNLREPNRDGHLHYRDHKWMKAIYIFSFVLSLVQ